MTTAIFLYIAILLPAIAFGSLNDESTRGEIGMNMYLNLETWTLFSDWDSWAPANFSMSVSSAGCKNSYFINCLRK